jgi:hypothetical protein
VYLQGDRLEATVRGMRSLAGRSVLLRDFTSPTAIGAIETRTFAEGPPVAVAIVYNGQEVFMGNESLTKADDPSRYLGLLPGLVHAIDRTDVRAFGPASRVTVISYAAGARVRVASKPMPELRGTDFGTQHDYYNQIGTDLVQGIELGLAELRRSDLPRKVLLVIGDGNDTNNELAETRLATLKKQAAIDRVETRAVIYKTAVSAEHEVIAAMIPGAYREGTATGAGLRVKGILDELTAQSYVSFPAYKLAWDGRDHAFTLVVDGVEHDAGSLYLAKVAGPPAEKTWPRWLLQLGLGLLLVGIVALISRWRFSV